MNEETKSCGDESSASSASTTATTVSTPGEPAGTPVVDPAVPGESGSGTATEPAKIKFTSKIRRGLALMRMVNMGALSDDAPPPTRIMSKMTKKQEEEYNAAMAWIEQEEDWDAVSKVWQEAGGQ